jgi:hypothetical protein
LYEEDGEKGVLIPTGKTVQLDGYKLERKAPGMDRVGSKLMPYSLGFSCSVLSWIVILSSRRFFACLPGLFKWAEGIPTIPHEGVGKGRYCPCVHLIVARTNSVSGPRWRKKGRHVAQCR